MPTYDPRLATGPHVAAVVFADAIVQLILDGDHVLNGRTTRLPPGEARACMGARKPRRGART